MDPGEKAQNLSLLMKGLAGRQTRYVNKIYEKSGTLWEGRYKSSLICGDEYLLACSRYVELNPVRAGIVDEPEKYQWSSYRSKIGMDEQSWLDLDPWYMGLGNDQKEREEKYEKLVRGMNLEEGYDKIRQAIQRGQLTGSSRFEGEIATKIGRRISFRGQGRPPATENRSVPFYTN
jgi:putative transposase